jgi:AcrR family transcriptional regulator
MASQSQPRLPLSRDRILRAAVELVDEHGLDALTMRRLGQELGFEAMSLYNHVANKDEVIDGMLDLVLDEGELPAPGGDWETSIRESAISIHSALRKHPWAANVLMSYGQVRPARLQYMESLLRRLREAGFSAQTTYHVYHVLDGHIFGFSLWETAHSFSDEEESEMQEMFDNVITAEAFPYLREHGQQHMSEGPHRDVSAFAFGLDLIVDGLKRIHAEDGSAG